MCPCFSGKLYEVCCKSFHEGKRFPDTVEQLMRSRYSAYAKGFADYIIKTTHPNNQAYVADKIKWSKEILQFSKTTQFTGLDILDSSQSDQEGTVTFMAHLRQNNQNASFEEKSLFKKIDKQWLYYGADYLKS